MTGPTIDIVEVSPRDGIQNEAAILGAPDKVALIGRAVAAGARRIEAASFVNPKRVPQMANAEQVMAALPRPKGVRYIGLALNRRGFARARAAQVDEVNFAIFASETFNTRNQGVATAETMAHWAEIALEAHAAAIPCSFTISAAFGCPYEGEVAVGRVVELAAQAAERDPAEIALADTIGCAAPSDVRERVAAVRAAVPDTPLRCHFHNTRNTGMANAVAAVEAGVQALDASIGGFGGCPFAPAATGNIPTEDLAYMLRRMGVDTGLDLARLIAAADWLAARLGRAAPAMLGKAGLFPPV